MTLVDSRTLLVSMLLPGVVWGYEDDEGEYVEPCKEIRWVPNNVYFVRSTLHVATHIILPEPMQGSPVAGDGTLWSVSGENIHLFVQPKTSKVEEGAQTSTSVVSTSNTSYDFLIERVYEHPDVCIKIVKDGPAQFTGLRGGKPSSSG